MQFRPACRTRSCAGHAFPSVSVAATLELRGRPRQRRVAAVWSVSILRQFVLFRATNSSAQSRWDTPAASLMRRAHSCEQPLPLATIALTARCTTTRWALRRCTSGSQAMRLSSVMPS